MATPRWRAVVGPALVALVALAALGRAHLAARAARARGAAHAPEGAPADVRALLDGLAPGVALAGWEVRAVRAPRDAMVAIDVARGAAGFTVSVARRGAKPWPAPVASSRYVFYYGARRPSDAAVPLAECANVMAAVADRVRRTERRVPVPRGME